MAEGEHIEALNTGALNTGGKHVSDEDCSVCVAVHIRPLIASELTEGCQTCLSVAPGEPQVCPIQRGVQSVTEMPHLLVPKLLPVLPPGS